MIVTVSIGCLADGRPVVEEYTRVASTKVGSGRRGGFGGWGGGGGMNGHRRHLQKIMCVVWVTKAYVRVVSSRMTETLIR